MAFRGAGSNIFRVPDFATRLNVFWVIPDFSDICNARNILLERVEVGVRRSGTAFLSALL